MMINFFSLRFVFSEECGTTFSKNEVGNIGLSGGKVTCLSGDHNFVCFWVHVVIY